MKIILVLLPLLAIASQKHYEHLSLEWVKGEAVRLTYQNRQAIFDTISKQKSAMKMLIERHDEVTKTDGEEAWKEMFEEKYADDFDRAIVTSEVCKILYEKDEKCETTLKWDHQYDTRDAAMKSEFHSQVEKTIQDAVQLRIEQFNNRHKQEDL